MDRNAQRMVGKVISNAMDKTVVVWALKDLWNTSFIRNIWKGLKNIMLMMKRTHLMSEILCK